MAYKVTSTSEHLSSQSLQKIWDGMTLEKQKELKPLIKPLQDMQRVYNLEGTSDLTLSDKQNENFEYLKNKAYDAFLPEYIQKFLYLNLENECMNVIHVGIIQFLIYSELETI